MNSRLRAIAFLAVTSLMASSCGGGEDAAPAASSTTVAVAVETSVPTTPVAADQPLTDSFRGVTSTEIHIGVGIIDASVFGFNTGDGEQQWQVALDAVNEAGGVHGRLITPTYESYLPVGTIEPEAACTRLVEDLGVFAFLGAVRENNELCYTELGNTIVVNSNPVTDEVIGRSGGLVFSTEPTDLQREFNAIAVLDAAGMLEGQSLSVRADPAREGMVEPVTEALEAAGANVVRSTVRLGQSGDIVAQANEGDQALERAVADGADGIYAISDQGLTMAGAAERAFSDLPIFSTSVGASTFLTFGYDLSAIDYVGIGREPYYASYQAGEESIVRCVDRVQAAGQEVSIGVPDPEVDNLDASVRICRAVDLFVAIATAAGPYLTNDSFVAAAAMLDDIVMTGSASASLSAEKSGADNTPFGLLRWDAELLAFRVSDS
jgi:hypothetical protein